MEFIKIVPSKEKTEEEKLWERRVKDNSILSDTFRLLSEEYPEKFGENIKGRIDGKTIILTGDLDIQKSESYEKVLESNGKKEKYSIILIN